MRVAVISNRNLPGLPDENLEDHLAWINRAASQISEEQLLQVIAYIKSLTTEGGESANEP